MFRRLIRKEEPSVLDEPIAELLTKMNKTPKDSDEYAKMVKQLNKLVRMKAETQRRRVSPDTLAIVVGSLLNILVIVAYENKHVMVSKAQTFILKPRDPRIMS